VHGADDVCDHVDHLFLATQLRPDESAMRRNGISPRVRRLSFTQAVDLVLSGQLPHAGSSHALLLTALSRARA
jgi:ADP-ribose pyrophosphatase